MCETNAFKRNWVLLSVLLSVLCCAVLCAVLCRFELSQFAGLRGHIDIFVLEIEPANLHWQALLIPKLKIQKVQSADLDICIFVWAVCRAPF